MSCSTANAGQERQHRQQANRALAVSAIGLSLAGGLELALALVTGSVALLGDALHNLSDVSTSLAVFLGFKVSQKPASRHFPYGFERAEDLAGLVVALVIWSSAFFAGYQSYHKLLSHAGTTHVFVGMAGAIAGILANQLVARYKARVGRRIQSMTLLADAKHSWLDALSSGGALLGLVLVALGHPLGDPLAGIAVTLFIVHVGYEVTKDILEHLMDGVDPAQLDAAEVAARTVPGVQSARARGRWLGRSLVVEVEGELPQRLSLEEADEIGHRVRHAILDAVDGVREVRWSAHSQPTHSSASTAS
ncbi:MAG TPA: cation diffusion facilitator family transporter [Chloroflexota bacterium]|nr:cation diffusion facilitator family transporter [Chloroflexota bacterium]